MDCRLEHIIEKTDMVMKFHVPFPKDEWHKILAFFKWGYDTYKSEQMVRLYVNGTTRAWRAWAYPQRGNMGMTVKEVEDHENFMTQRAQFKDEEGWTYFGSVHHHCNGGAFQSGTDEADEKSKDGLHITMGNMDEKVYSMDARFYLRGAKFPPKLLWFWDIGTALNEIPAWVPEKSRPEPELIAKFQMCMPAPAGTEVPKEWKDNIILPPPVKTERINQLDLSNDSWQRSTGHNGYHEGKEEWLARARNNYVLDLNRCVGDIANYMKRYNSELVGFAAGHRKTVKPEELMTREEIWEILENIVKTQEHNDHVLNVVGFLARHDVTPANLLAHWKREGKEHKVAPKKISGPVIINKSSIPDGNNGNNCSECGLAYPYHTQTCKNAYETPPVLVK